MNTDPDTASIDPLLLQAYFDDELTPEERLDVESRLESLEDAQLQLDALKEMSELVAFDTHERVEEVDVDMWRRLEGALETSAPVKQRASTTVDEKPGLWEVIRNFFGAHKNILVPAAVMAAIAALVVAPSLLNQPPPQTVIEKDQTIVIVEPLHFEGDSMGAVSYTPDSRTPVIWYLGGETPEPVPATADQLKKLRLNVPLEKLLPLRRLDRLGIPRPGSSTDTTEPDGPI